MEETAITSFYGNGESVVWELREVLKRRERKIEQFQYYRNIFGGLISDLMESFDVDEETVLSAIFVSKYALTDLRKTELDAQKRVSEVAYIRMVLESLLESRNNLPIKLEDIIALIQITVEVANRIERFFVENWRLHVPEDVIAVNAVDLFIKPLFEFYIQYCGKNANFRWIMAELEGALRNNLPKQQYEDILNSYPELFLDKENFLDAGLYIIERYFSWYHLDTIKQTFVSQTRSIEEPKLMIGTNIFFNGNLELIDEPNFTKEIQSSNLIIARNAIHSLAQFDRSFSRKLPFELRFVKFRLRLRSSNQMLPERGMFLTSIKDNEKECGAISALILPAEDINVQYVTDTLLSRLLDLGGIFSHARKLEDSTAYISSVLTKWAKTVQYNALNLSETIKTVDSFRDAAGEPVVALSQEISDSRMDYVLGKFDLEDFGYLTEFLSHIARTCSEFVVASLRGLDTTMTDVELIPWECVLEHRKESSKFLLVQFANDDSRITGIITQVDPEKFQVDTGRLLKRRVVQSKAGQLLTQKRVDTLEDALRKKMSDQFRVSRIGEIDKTFYYHTEILYETETETVSEIAIEELKRKELARQEFFENQIARFVHDEIVIRIGEVFLHLVRRKGGVRDIGLIDLDNSLKDKRKQLDSLKVLEILPEELARGIRLIIEDTVEDTRTKLFDHIEILKSLSDLCHRLKDDDFQRISSSLSECSPD